MRILGISGSLKPTSTNSALLRAAARLMPEADFEGPDSIVGELPHFRPDLDEEGSIPPPAVAAFRSQVAAADGLLISCPEYAHGVPGAFKNALDWLVSSSELTGKPLALVMAGPGGAVQARAALVPTLRVMGCDIVHECSLVVAGRHFAEDGGFADEKIAAELRRALEALASAVR